MSVKKVTAIVLVAIATLVLFAAFVVISIERETIKSVAIDFFKVTNPHDLEIFPNMVEFSAVIYIGIVLLAILIWCIKLMNDATKS